MVNTTAIIPAYNEDKTIFSVLESLLTVKFINKIIVVDDGSTDNTASEIAKFKNKVTFIQNKLNKGKGYSVALGLEKISKNYNGLILLLDADILGYSNKNLSKLTKPVLNKSFDWTVGTTSLKTYKKPNFMTNFIGQRCYKFQDLEPLVPQMKKTEKYGLEVLLNKKLKDKKYKLVYLENTKHFLKSQKRNALVSIKEYITEFISVVKQCYTL